MCSVPTTYSDHNDERSTRETRESVVVMILCVPITYTRFSPRKRYNNIVFRVSGDILLNENDKSLERIKRDGGKCLHLILNPVYIL